MSEQEAITRRRGRPRAAKKGRAVYVPGHLLDKVLALLAEHDHPKQQKAPVSPVSPE